MNWKVSSRRVVCCIANHVFTMCSLTEVSDESLRIRVEPEEVVPGAERESDLCKQKQEQPTQNTLVSTCCSGRCITSDLHTRVP